MTHETLREHIWLVRGALRDVETGELVLVVGGTEAEGRQIAVDRAGRVDSNGRLRELSGVAFVAEDSSLGGAEAIHRAFESTVRGADRPGLLSFLRAMIDEQMPMGPKIGLVVFSAAPARVPWNGGLDLSRRSTSARPDGLWRGGVKEAVRAATSVVVLTQDNRLVILADDLLTVWCRLNGTPGDELARSLGFAPTRLNHAVRSLRELGVMAAEAQWSLGDDVVCATTDQAEVYLARRGSMEPPVVLDGWGAAIWSIVAESGPISAAQIVARLSEEAESLHDDIANDVEAFLVDLGQRGLVRC
ncbi:PqqD family protein [Microbacterium sp. Bi128]|uniref:PqqD family protein n=1 Tax=Microbacterium sp. Bi128 TaxID=2821115 RepID=UPI001E0E1341|nr:PqqD family protein [Microbacterium sp. Bi128]CAH0130367.1 hypothetical protein SRABI128_00058 [Microbacterium sp. Bi128]